MSMPISAIEPAPTGKRLRAYKASKGRKLFEGRAAAVNGSAVELRDSKGVVLTREDTGSHERACRIAREWCE